jgi:tripartite-type tricarboxylate transporter receptor subunit TctC
VKDFSPIILILSVPNLLVVHPSVPATSVRELIALAKANPGTLSFASQGNGSGGHMVGEQFMMATGIDLVHVPYRGGGPAVQDLLGGQVSMMFDAAALALPNIRSGKVRALAVATSQRMAAAPEIPTMAEAGVPGIESGAWFGLFAPAATPRPVIDWINREAAKVYSDPQIRNRFIAQGAAFSLGTPEEFAAYISADLERWSRIVKSANIKID